MAAARQIILRPYQVQLVESVLHAFIYERRALAVAATGLGKTIALAEIARRWNRGRVLVIAHRDELISQTAKKLHLVTGSWPDIEQAGLYANESSVWGRNQFVVGSVQSLHERRLTENRFNDIGLLVIDEAHRAASENASYGRIIAALEKKNPELRILGLTATPDRPDGKKLMFDKYCFKYPLRPAIDDGWLVPIKNQIVIVKELDFSKVRKSNGDLNQRELAAILEAEAAVQEIATTTASCAGDKPTVVFTASVAQAEATCAILNRIKPGKAKWLCGDQAIFPKPLRREILAQFDNGDFQFLVNHAVLTEGWDSPIVRMIAWARPTLSDTVYLQGIGRGTRPLEGVIDAPGLLTAEDRKAAIAASDKPYVEIIDFCDQSRRSDIVTACSQSVLGGYFSEAEVTRAKSEIEKKSAQGEACDIDEELEAARKAIQQEEEAEAARKRREAEEERKQREENRRKGIVADVSYELQEHDLFDNRSKGSGRQLAVVRGDPVTEKQAKWLENVGINPNSVNRKQAQGIINQIRNGTFKGRKKPSAVAVSPNDVNRLLAEAARH